MRPARTHPLGTPPSLGRRAAVAVAAGGAIGAVARAGLAEAFPADGGWPWGTFAANMAGTALLAFLFGRLVHPGVTTRLWRLFAGTGFCGALTTFSAFQVEVIDLARSDHAALAVTYGTVSLVAGLALAVAFAAAGREMAYR